MSENTVKWEPFWAPEKEQIINILESGEYPDNLTKNDLDEYLKFVDTKVEEENRRKLTDTEWAIPKAREMNECDQRMAWGALKHFRLIEKWLKTTEDIPPHVRESYMQNLMTGKTGLMQHCNISVDSDLLAV